MEGLRDWGVSLCLVTAATALLQLLAPKNGLGKLLEMIGSAAFLLCALAPLVTVDWQTDGLFLSPLSETGQRQLLAERLRDQLEPPLQTAVWEQGSEALAAYGLSAEKIEAVMDIDDRGGIYITKILVTLDASEMVRRRTVQEVLTTRFQVETEVIEDSG